MRRLRVESRRDRASRWNCRRKPRRSRSVISGQEQFTPWDDLDVAYFSGEALYTYCNTPFLCTYTGFSSEEISSIQVDGETWRRLRVIFPDTVKSHTKTQIFCFGPDGLLRRFPRSLQDFSCLLLNGT